jgi:hypothetical protein
MDMLSSVSTLLLYNSSTLSPVIHGRLSTGLAATFWLGLLAEVHAGEVSQRLESLPLIFGINSTEPRHPNEHNTIPASIYS